MRGRDFFTRGRDFFLTVRLTVEHLFWHFLTQRRRETQRNRESAVKEKESTECTFGTAEYRACSYSAFSPMTAHSICIFLYLPYCSAQSLRNSASLRDNYPIEDNLA